MTPTIPTLETERLNLRPLSAADFPAFADFYASERAKFVGGPTTPAASWRNLASEIGHWALRGYGRWAVDETATGKFCGVVGLWCPLDWPEPEIGWDLMAGFEGKGYATEAALAARTFAYDTLGWTTAISLVAEQNDASRAVAKRMGASRDGTFTHDSFGLLEIWRHTSPDQVAR